MSPPNRANSNATTRNMIVQACTRSVARDAGSPPCEMYAAVTIPTMPMAMRGSISERVSIAFPIAVNSAKRKVNM